MNQNDRRVGTVSRGIRCPIIRQGDDLAEIVTASVLEAAESEKFELRDRDVIAITESIVARAQGNYASVEDIAADVKAKLGGETVGVIFPILSRNRFAICLKGIAMGAKKVVLMLSYPSDEVGNQLVSIDKIDAAGINPYSDVLTEEKYRELFGENKHEFTGVDYVAYYGELIRSCGAECEIIFANQAKAILDYTDCIINCDIHTRARTKRILKEAGAKIVCGLDDILNAPVNGSGCNEKYGLLGSNKSTETTIKLFPKDCKDLVLAIQAKILEKTEKHVEVMVYGDGAFKDPQGKIWELADPVVSPAYTDGLIGTPNELKLKYLADNDFKDLSGDALKEAISASIREKGDNLVGNMASQGTTPRQLTDLIGSLCDLTSGSGDKGTPVILVQGYFDNYTTDTTPKDVRPASLKRIETKEQADAFIAEQIDAIRKQVGDKKVLLALSGGVDSSVVAALLIKAIGKQLVCVHVNHGLMRKGESENVIEVFGKNLDANLIYVEAADRFLYRLGGVTDPEQKRKIIGEEFINVFNEEAAKLDGVAFLAQGTIYPDILESKGVKAHHNVGGLPEDMKVELVEPVKFLYKDEVRVVGDALGLPHDMVYRQPFPGPGLGVRCLGAITRNRLDALREADAILREEFEKNGLAGKVWQYFIAVPDMKSVGVKDGKRYEGWPAIIRAVNTTDAMTATIEEIPYSLLHHITDRITHEVPGINRVLMDLTPKPIGTIEWE